VSGAAGRSAEVLRAGSGVSVDVGTAGHAWLSHISHIYKDACGLAQAKGLPSLIYHEPTIEVEVHAWGSGHDEHFDHATGQQDDANTPVAHFVMIAALTQAQPRSKSSQNRMPFESANYLAGCAVGGSIPLSRRYIDCAP
jgi:hypothetical protein